MAIFSRTDLGLHGELSASKVRAVAQDIRDRPDGSGGGGLWGNISGDIDNQPDLKDRLARARVMDYFLGE